MNKWWDRGWNPVKGCTKCSEGCENCYAENLLNKRKKSDKNLSFDVFQNKKQLNKEFEKGEEFIFVCSQSDLFHEEVWQQFLDKIFERISKEEEKKFAILTKRSLGMREYLEEVSERGIKIDYDKIIFGVSVENNKNKYRIQDLIECKHIKNRFVSIEPILEEISIKEYLESGKINWVTVGEETGENKRESKREWIEKIIDECKEFNVPVFVINADEDLKNKKEFFKEFKTKK